MKKKPFIPNPRVCEHCGGRFKTIDLEIGKFKQCSSCGALTKK